MQEDCAAGPCTTVGATQSVPMANRGALVALPLVVPEPSELDTVTARNPGAAPALTDSDSPVICVPRRSTVGAPVTVTPPPSTVTCKALTTFLRLVPVIVTGTVAPTRAA